MARVVGSRGTFAAQRERAEYLLDWACAMQRRRWTSRYLPSARLRIANLRRQSSAHAVGTFAVRAISRHADKTQAEVLELLDTLLAIGVPEQPVTAPEVAAELPPALYPVA